ncbi:MAG: hypothetical protein Q7T76_20355, partial [Ferruginibacter sp.]|nr:hypothetical protein [Ferruginibacter sp.]
GGYKVAFYAGTPVISAAGFKLGTVCAMDSQPKQHFSLKQRRALKIIADQVAALLELGVGNKRMSTKANQLLTAEKDIVQKTIVEQEEEKNFIANELHENFAQTLAATKLYLDFAEQSKELSTVFIRKAKGNILQIIRDIKALSKSMLPSTFQNANYLRFIQEMLEEYGKQNKKEIEFVHQGKLDAYESQVGLTIFRIIQLLLKSAQSCRAKKISITINTAETIKLILWDDGKSVNELGPDRKIMLRHIEARLSLVKGTLATGKDKNGHNLVELEIPQGQEEKA